MSGVVIRRAGRAGRITLDRPQAMNALTADMLAAIEAAIEDWAAEDGVALVVIDAEGQRAFCAGGDISMIHAAGKAGDLETPRAFWRDEYRLNARLATCPKPIATFMQGFTMGGGVGIGCHAAHRVVGETSRIAMPECGIGLVPDVGGSLILGRAPGHLGEYLGLTGSRMDPALAIEAGFADRFVPEAEWPALIAGLERDGDPGAITEAATDPGTSALAENRDTIDAIFGAPDRAAMLDALDAAEGAFAAEAQAALARVSPLSAACAFDLIRESRRRGTIHGALEMEYRFTHRAIADSDLMEGVRASVIDKDRSPRWRHRSIREVTGPEVEAMLAPLGPAGLQLGGQT